MHAGSKIRPGDSVTTNKDTAWAWGAGTGHGKLIEADVEASSIEAHKTELRYVGTRPVGRVVRRKV